jgi:hypothetical protein
MGAALQSRIPLQEGAIPLTGPPPPQFVALQYLLLEAAGLPSVNTAFLEATKSSRIYKDWMADHPTSSSSSRCSIGTSPGRGWRPPSCLQWLWTSIFGALHNLLLTMERPHRFRDAPSPACPALTQYTQKGVIPAENVSKKYFKQFKRPSSNFFKIVCRNKNKKISNECFLFLLSFFTKMLFLRVLLSIR